MSIEYAIFCGILIFNFLMFYFFLFLLRLFMSIENHTSIKIRSNLI